MGAAFPAAPPPGYYAVLTLSVRNGVYYSDGSNGSPSVTLSQSGATNYSVRDYFGTVVSSGTFSGTTCTPTAPGGGWLPGWYRVYLTGGSTDALFGPSYGAINFAVVRNTSYMYPIGSIPAFSPGAQIDPAIRAVMGAGPSRISAGDASNTATAPSLTHIEGLVSTLTTYYSNPGSPYADSARPRPIWLAFPNGTVDVLNLPGSGGGNYLHCYAKTATLAPHTDQITVALAAGSSSGAKITVVSTISGNSGTEVYDNQANATAAAAAIIAGSSFIAAYVGNTAAAGTLTATAIGNAFWNGMISWVSTLYPLGVTRFEGPQNEPVLGPNMAQQMMLFQAAVHAGNASALAIGPCPVDITASLTGTNSWTSFLNAGGGAFCDEISFHDYNAINGDLNMGRSSITTFLALLAAHGLSSVPLWQTEATWWPNPVFGVYHARHSTVPLLQTLLWEQYGMARERNPNWYDAGNDWTVPSWFEAADLGLEPHAVLYRVLAEETFGQTHNQILDFGSPGNNIFLGSVYTTPGGGTSTAVIMAQSSGMTSVALNVTGTTSPLTVVDGLGNSSTVSISGGLAVIPVAEIPTYVQLPSGASVTVHTWNGRPTTLGSNSAPLATATINGVANTALNDGAFMTAYTAGSKPGVVFSTGTLPGDTVVLTWATPEPVDYVTVFCGGVWQQLSALTDFIVETSVDGTTFVTQATVVDSTCSSFNFGTDSSDVGCEQETYWDERWIYDIAIPRTTCKALRITATSTSYGGEPDAAAITAGGQGYSSQRVTIQDVQTFANTSTVTVLPPRGSAVYAT